MQFPVETVECPLSRHFCYILHTVFTLPVSILADHRAESNQKGNQNLPPDEKSITWKIAIEIIAPQRVAYNV